VTPGWDKIKRSPPGCNKIERVLLRNGMDDEFPQGRKNIRRVIPGCENTICEKMMRVS
jgi:hypothetical protein